jgi:hypothetical protein
VPSDGFAFTIVIGCDDDVFFSELRDNVGHFLDVGFFVGVQRKDRFEIVFGVDGFDVFDDADVAI